MKWHHVRRWCYKRIDYRQRRGRGRNIIRRRLICWQRRRLRTVNSSGILCVSRHGNLDVAVFWWRGKRKLRLRKNGWFRFHGNSCAPKPRGWAKCWLFYDVVILCTGQSRHSGRRPGSSLFPRRVSRQKVFLQGHRRKLLKGQAPGIGGRHAAVGGSRYSRWRQ